MTSQQTFVDVILPLALDGSYTYLVPDNLVDEVDIGKRVVIQFGRQRIYSALIINIHQQQPLAPKIKEILSVLDSQPIVNKVQLEFWKWLAAYYICTIGEVMNAALPTSLKLASETKIMLNPLFDGDLSMLNDREYLVAEALDRQPILTITEVSRIVDQKKVFNLIKSLIEKQVVLVDEELTNKYKPKTETYIRLHDRYKEEKLLQELFDNFNKRAQKQLDLLMLYYSLSKWNSSNFREIKRSELLSKKQISANVLRELVKKDIFIEYHKNISRLKEFGKPSWLLPKLSDSQERALQEIKNLYANQDVVLLHGITSSGKTEIYNYLITETLKNKKQVLFLLPEIALTTQIIERLKKIYGNLMGVYHSRFNENERAEVWKNITSQEHTEQKEFHKVLLAVGARSALFLPFNNLGLIIVDEEHDSSYKQNDQNPRYHARDAAIYLAYLHKSKVLLGSATPSLETYYNANNEKYGLVKLNTRYADLLLPEIKIIDLMQEHIDHAMQSHFSKILLKNIDNAVKSEEQVILFQNRRGFSTRLECNICHHNPVCKYCDVTLTYHKQYQQLRCHYCGYAEKIPAQCPQCGNAVLKLKGFGTEKIEDELAIFFPDAHIGRMDVDTTKRKNAYNTIISAFEEGKINILVGTQMVTKGLDFDNVSIVGVLNADNLINFPDFRAYEKSFQLLCQVSGRAGRKKKRGLVLIQTYNPGHRVISLVKDNNYESLYAWQLEERQKFNYPPFTRLTELTLKHKNPDKLDNAAQFLAILLRKIFGKRVLGPEYPVVSRINDEFIKKIMLKFEKSLPITSTRHDFLSAINTLQQHNDFKSVKLTIDVDPI